MFDIVVYGWHYLPKEEITKDDDIFKLIWSPAFCLCRKGVRMAYDTRTSMALFRSFTASDYVAAQCLR